MYCDLNGESGGKVHVCPIASPRSAGPKVEAGNLDYAASIEANQLRSLLLICLRRLRRYERGMGDYNSISWPEESILTAAK